MGEGLVVVTVIAPLTFPVPVLIAVVTIGVRVKLVEVTVTGGVDAIVGDVLSAGLDLRRGEIREVVQRQF